MLAGKKWSRRGDAVPGVTTEPRTTALYVLRLEHTYLRKVPNTRDEFKPIWRPQ